MTVHTDTELTNSEWYNQELANKNSHRTHLVIKKRKRCNLVFFFFEKRFLSNSAELWLKTSRKMTQTEPTDF